MKFARYLGPLIGLTLFGAAGWALHTALAEYHYQEVIDALKRLPTAQLWTALLVTAFSYLIATGYDGLALRYIQRPLPWSRISFAATLSYAFSNSVGLSVFASGSLRYRLYSSWGLSAVEIARIILFAMLTFWLGILTVGGAVLALTPLAPGAIPGLPLDRRWLGGLMLALSATWLLLGVLRRQPLRLGPYAWPIVRTRLAMAQLAVGALDCVMASLALYVLLPDTAAVAFSQVVGAFLVAQSAGLLSQVPGGLGVFESVALWLLHGQLPIPELLGALLAYRLIYYLLPLALAALALGFYEFRRALSPAPAAAVDRLPPPVHP